MVPNVQPRSWEDNREGASCGEACGSDEMIDRVALRLADWSNVVRLARALKVRVHCDGCGCLGHRRGLIERIVRVCE